MHLRETALGVGEGNMEENGRDQRKTVLKGHKDIFRFSFFPRTIPEWNKLPQETVSSQSLCIFKSKLI